MPMRSRLPDDTSRRTMARTSGGKKTTEARPKRTVASTVGVSTACPADAAWSTMRAATNEPPQAVTAKPRGRYTTGHGGALEIWARSEDGAVIRLRAFPDLCWQHP